MKKFYLIYTNFLVCFCWSCYITTSKTNDSNDINDLKTDDKDSDGIDQKDIEIFDDHIELEEIPVSDFTEEPYTDPIVRDFPPEFYPMCWSNSDCYDFEFCEFPDGVCAPPGTCRGRGNGSCPISMEGMACGCNNVTYWNDCVRQWAGVSKKHQLSCNGREGCYQGAPWTVCGVESEFCASGSGTCNSEFSFCQIKTYLGQCPDEWIPVCGCDGVTYEGRCHLEQAGAWLAHEGPCNQ